MYGGVVVEPEILPKTQGTATEPETVAQFQVWLLKEPETVAKVMPLAVAEPEAVAHFTAWVVAAHETVFEFMVNVAEPETATEIMAWWSQSLRLS